ncbi:MAG TPA: anhydro-N-acetylmuramic acid kinase [Gemmataceae bacterium]|nr:anhydro-N-acetylmuramic acid kinase [Gemmataceae bacterium]
MTQTRWIIGLASGSCAESVDAVLLEVHGTGLELRVRLVQAVQQRSSRDLRELMFRVASAGTGDVRQICLLHRFLGEAFATAARQVADRASFSLQQVQCLGCPGHIAWHEPGGRFPSVLPLGMPAVVAERTGVTTVSDFWSRDLAVGGQGLPVLALADYLLFRNVAENRVLIHLGGAATVVCLPATGRVPELFGFEAGPCNLLLDGLMRHVTGGRETHDPGGKHAVQGRCIDPLLERWLEHPYLLRRPPKSLSREEFGEAFIAQAVRSAQQMHRPLHDLLCTATHFVARGTTSALKRFLPAGDAPHRLLLSGGGARNGLLWRLLEQDLAPIPLEKTDAHGVPADLRKAVAHGVHAALAVDGIPANIPSATRATGSRLLGNLTPGSSANWARCIAWMAAQTPVLAAA